jgi:hypothetical protein
MGRPKAANLKTFSLYNLLHTVKTKMYCGVELTTLHSIKENAIWYTSIEVWAFCASKFKAKKKNVTLSVDIPLVTDEKAIAFLNKHCWANRVEKEINDNDSETIEIVAALKKLFPDKEPVYFYELDSLIVAWCNGSFLSYDDNGNVETPRKHHIDNQKYYSNKYIRSVDAPHIVALEKKWTDEKNKELKERYLDEYFNAKEEYVFKHHNLTDVFIEICKNAVCYPFIFSKNTAEWSREKYGKLVGYAHAGEIFFVQTPDKVFFNVTRHF